MATVKTRCYHSPTACPSCRKLWGRLRRHGKPVPLFYCPACGKLCFKHTNNQRLCSVKCSRLHRHNATRLLGVYTGKTQNPRPSHISPRPFTCQACGKSEPRSANNQRWCLLCGPTQDNVRRAQRREVFNLTAPSREQAAQSLQELVRESKGKVNGR